MRRLLPVPLALALLLAAAPAGAVVDPATTACPPARVPGGAFDDVPPSAGHALAVDCLAEHRVLRGTGPGRFTPSADISRVQVALVLDRFVAYAHQASGVARTASGTADFDDVEGLPAEVRAAIGRLVDEGVLTGDDADGDGRASFRPTAPISRAQAAGVLLRVHDLVLQAVPGSGHERPSGERVVFDDVEGTFFEDAVEVLHDEGVVAGTGPRTFSPSGQLSRAHLALFTARLLEDLRDRVPSRYAAGGRPLDGASPVATPSAPQVVATGLSLPWGLAPLPGGGALVSERDSALVKRVAADGTVTTLGQVPGVAPGGEGGLLGLALSPTYLQDGYVHAYITTATDNRVVRFVLNPGPTGVQPVLTGIPRASIHNGGRLRFGPDGLLYVGTGDAADTSRSQSPSSLGGKVLRVRADGVPVGTPTPVFALGHRNVQGLAFDDGGRLWVSELGQSTWDEVNQVQAGRNSGWPVVEGLARRDGYADPRVQWPVAEASPSGAAFAGGSLWVAALRGQRLWQVPLADGVAGVPRAHLVGTHGRLRAVEQVADGSLWVLTNESPGRVLRLTLG